MKGASVSFSQGHLSGTAGTFWYRAMPCVGRRVSVCPKKSLLGLLFLLQQWNNRLPRHEALK
jgi:hypothetical protein